MITGSVNVDVLLCVRAVLKMAQQPISLQGPFGESDDTSFGDFIEDKGAENPADMAAIVLLLDQRFGVRDPAPRLQPLAPPLPPTPSPS
jgi:DNA-directed RNA polymerase sigma subunit (sigma70/sigma32)